MNLQPVSYGALATAKQHMIMSVKNDDDTWTASCKCGSSFSGMVATIGDETSLQAAYLDAYDSFVDHIHIEMEEHLDEIGYGDKYKKIWDTLVFL